MYTTSLVIFVTSPLAVGAAGASVTSLIFATYPVNTGVFTGEKLVAVCVSSAVAVQPL